MRRIFWDTNLFIYLFEPHPLFSARVIELRRAILDRRDQLFTSAMTVGEVLVRPLQLGDDEMRRRYESALVAGATVLPFDRAAARHYASIRASDKSIRPPDAIQLACAAEANTDLFITNDDRLSRKAIPGVRFISSLERAFI